MIPAQGGRPRSEDRMPAPFAWVAIPGGRRILRYDTWFGYGDEQRVALAPYAIAKYPVTNGQFALFVEAGGYDTPRWWTAEGWAHRQRAGWTAPRDWDEPEWNGADQPVVSLSWYEAMAFCLWLSDVTGETICLPTEAQWQVAAQGEDGRAYPWGDAWDGARCNHSVPPGDHFGTTPVTRFEGQGASPYGVVDLAGNVWEWCLTDYDSRADDPHARAKLRVLRGGSWFNRQAEFFRCDARYGDSPIFSNFHRGFRIVRLG
ncbi:MAG: formylglycine-generating enzyme family protein [Anaerolineae bacterium]